MDSLLMYVGLLTVGIALAWNQVPMILWLMGRRKGLSYRGYMPLWLVALFCAAGVGLFLLGQALRGMD